MGLGAKSTSSMVRYLPWNVGFSLDHSSVKAIRYSLVTPPRFSNGVGTIIAAASSRFQPGPIRMFILPFDSTSIVASILAASTGFR